MTVDQVTQLLQWSLLALFREGRFSALLGRAALSCVIYKEEFKGSYRERRWHQWQINQCSKHYNNCVSFQPNLISISRWLRTHAFWRGKWNIKEDRSLRCCMWNTKRMKLTWQNILSTSSVVNWHCPCACEMLTSKAALFLCWLNFFKRVQKLIFPRTTRLI